MTVIMGSAVSTPSYRAHEDAKNAAVRARSDTAIAVPGNRTSAGTA